MQDEQGRAPHEEAVDRDSSTIRVVRLGVPGNSAGAKVCR